MTAASAIRTAQLLRTITAVAVLASLLLLAACGGGDPADAQLPTDKPTPRVDCITLPQGCT